MNTPDKTKEQLIAELAKAHERIATLEKDNQRLLQKEHDFLITMKYSPISMQVYTPDGVLRSYNRAFEKLFNLDGLAHVNKYNVFKDKKVKEIGAIPLLEKVIAGETVYNFVSEYDPKVGFGSQAGRQCWLKSCLYPIKDNDGKVRNFVIMHEDITQLKLHEIELKAQVKQQTASLEKQNKELARLINIDVLTQIANRRCFEQRLENAWLRLLREQKPVSLLFIDIDCFKSYNDFYGHQVGDYCLKQVAQAINATVKRPDDLAARYGGEEFVVLLPHTNEAGAVMMAENIKAAIHHLKMPHEHSKVSAYVTCSMGIVSVVPSQKMSSKKLIAVADEAMYDAKRQGRNCYVVASAFN